jgi:hypothetical protein
VSEDQRDTQFMWDAVNAALKKAYEHNEYSIRLDDPNDLRLPGLEQLRRGQPGTFTEEDMAVFFETVRDDAFRLGARRGAEEVLARILARLGAKSLADAEVYVRRGKGEIS